MKVYKPSVSKTNVRELNREDRLPMVFSLFKGRYNSPSCPLLCRTFVAIKIIIVVVKKRGLNLLINRPNGNPPPVGFSFFTIITGTEDKLRESSDFPTVFRVVNRAKDI